MMEGEEELEEEEEEDGEESFPHVYFFARFMRPIKSNHTFMSCLYSLQLNLLKIILV